MRDSLDSHIKVMVIHHLTTFREAVAELISQDPGLIVVGQGATTEDALSIIERFHPEILLLDMDIPEDMRSFAHQLIIIHPEIKIIEMTYSETGKADLPIDVPEIYAHIRNDTTVLDLTEMIHKIAQT